MIAVWLFLAVPWVCLQFVIVVFPDHTRLLIFKSLLRQRLSETELYDELVYNSKNVFGSNNFSAQLIKIISHYKKISYSINVLQ